MHHDAGEARAGRSTIDDHVDRIGVRTAHSPQGRSRSVRCHRPVAACPDRREHPLLASDRRARNPGNPRMDDLERAVPDRPIPGVLAHAKLLGDRSRDEPVMCTGECADSS